MKKIAAIVLSTIGGLAVLPWIVATVAHATVLQTPSSATQFHSLADSNHVSVFLGIDPTTFPLLSTSSDISVQYKIDPGGSPAGLSITIGALTLLPGSEATGTSYVFDSGTGIVTWTISPTASPTLLNAINPVDHIQFNGYSSYTGHLWGGSATSTTFVYGQYRDNVNTPYGTDSVVPYVQIIASVPVPYSPVTLVWPGSPGSFSVPGFSYWKLHVDNALPLDATTTYEALTVRYFKYSTSTDGHVDSLAPWTSPASGDVLVPSDDFIKSTDTTGTDIYAQPVYTTEDASGTFTISEGPQYHFKLSSVAPDPPVPTASGTGPYFRNPAILNIETCGYDDLVLFSIPDPWCNTKNFFSGLWNDITIKFSDGGAVLESIFPVNVYAHLKNDFTAPETITASSTIQFKFIDKTYTLASSSSLESAAGSLGMTDYRGFLDYVMYGLTGLFMVVVSILVVAWLNNKNK